ECTAARATRRSASSRATVSPSRYATRSVVAAGATPLSASVITAETQEAGAPFHQWSPFDARASSRTAPAARAPRKLSAAESAPGAAGTGDAVGTTSTQLRSQGSATDSRSARERA